MVEYIVFVFSVMGAFLLGARNSVTVDKAIAKIEEAEQSAQAVLAKITDHKAN